MRLRRGLIGALRPVTARPIPLCSISLRPVTGLLIVRGGIALLGISAARRLSRLWGVILRGVALVLTQIGADDMGLRS